MGAGETFEKEELIYKGGCKHQKENCLVIWECILGRSLIEKNKALSLALRTLECIVFFKYSD